MLMWAIIFFLVACLAGLFGFTKIAIFSAELAKIIFVIFLILFIASAFIYATGSTFGMLSWAFLFLIVSIIAAIFGFTGIASASAQMAKILFFIFLVLFIISFVMHLFGIYR